MPMASPTPAAAHRPAAVVSPLTRYCRVTRIVPTPRKPMPLTTCAGMRPTSPVWKKSARYWEVSMTSAAPMHTSMYVRSPAARRLRVRSSPSTPPHTAASSSRTVTVSPLSSSRPPPCKTIPAWKTLLCVISDRRGHRPRPHRGRRLPGKIVQRRAVLCRAGPAAAPDRACRRALTGCAAPSRHGRAGPCRTGAPRLPRRGRRPVGKPSYNGLRRPVKARPAIRSPAACRYTIHLGQEEKREEG